MLSKQLWKSSRRSRRRRPFWDFHKCGSFHSLPRPSLWAGVEALMGKERRKFEVAFKKQLIAQIEAGVMTGMQAARTHQIAPSMIERWRRQYREQKLENPPTSRERQLEAENQKLKAKIGELVMQNDQLKKLQHDAQRLKNADTSVITAKNLDQFRKDSK
jgi:transposase-like protein